MLTAPKRVEGYCACRRVPIAIAAAVVGAGLGLVEIHARPMSLEEIFLALVGKGDRGAPDGAPGGEIHARD